MILVDFSHLSARMMFVSIEQSKRNGYANKFTADNKIDISCYKNFYLHLLFTSLSYIKKDFSKEYGEVILCLDARSYWRKDLFPDYKSGRSKKREKTQIDYKQFYEVVNETIEVLDKGFPFKVVKVEKAEGDDIIAVLAKNSKEKTLIVTEDKDMKQLLKYPNVKIYRPILGQYIDMDKEQLTFWRAEHIVGGDSGDDIPTIKENSEFSPNFIKYLNKNDIYETDVYKFNKLSISTKLYGDYKEVDKKGNIDIFKAHRFGEKSISDFVKNLRYNLKQNKILWENYKRNKKLIVFNHIPADIQDCIMESYHNSEINYNPLKIQSYFAENKLRKLSENVQDFFTSDNVIKVEKGMFDSWF